MLGGGTTIQVLPNFQGPLLLTKRIEICRVLSSYSTEGSISPMKHFVLLMVSKKSVMSMNRFTVFPDIPPFPGVCRDKKTASQLPAFSNILDSTVDISQAGEEGAA